ncbi:MAG TPA: DP-EP family protein [Telluria sp.]|jgi:hypothetical protein
MPKRKTEFLNVQVTAIETSPGKFAATFDPETLNVHRKDCVINYQLINSTGITFTGLTVDPADNDQFSVPSVSKSGKMITLSDANTDHKTFHISLLLTGKKNGNVDPEVINQPETTGPDDE